MTEFTFEKFRVRKDGHSLILDRKQWLKPTEKYPEGREAYVLIGYYTSIRQCLQGATFVTMQDALDEDGYYQNLAQVCDRLDVLADNFEARAKQFFGREDGNAGA